MGYSSPEYRMKYKRENYSEQDRLDMNKRKRDRYNFEKKNGKLPKGYELDHTNGIK
jgi:hypothetical protein